MIEGLWVVKWLLPEGVESDLTGGVAVIETNRLYGGDSGYIFVGSLDRQGSGIWKVDVSVTRHDPNITSLFGDLDQFALSGTLQFSETDMGGRSVMLAVFPSAEGVPLSVAMTKVAELP